MEIYFVRLDTIIIKDKLNYFQMTKYFFLNIYIYVYNVFLCGKNLDGVMIALTLFYLELDASTLIFVILG